MKFQENTVEVGVGFRNLQTARVFAEDPAATDTLASSSGGAEVDPENIVLAEEDGLGVVRVVMRGDRASILQCFDTVQKYGGWLRGALGGDPGSTAEAIGLALERGWKPGLTEENRPGGFGYAASSLDAPRPIPLPSPSPDIVTSDDELGSEIEEIKWEEDEEADRGPKERNLVVLVAGVLALAGMTVGGFAFLKKDPPPPASAPRASAEGAITDPVQYCEHAAALLADAFRLLPDSVGVGFDVEIDSVEFFDKLRGAFYTPWNPGMWNLVPGLEGLVRDPWGNPYRLLVSENGTGFSLLLRSCGPDGIDDGGENDDLKIRPVEMAAVETQDEGESGTTDLLASEIAGADSVTKGWKLQGGDLVSSKDGGMSLRGFDVAMPDEYKLEFSVERLAGNHAFVIGFPIKGRTVTAVIDAPLRKGATTMHGIGISRVVQRQGDEDDSPFMLATGQTKKVYVEVGGYDIRVGIRDGVEFVWDRGDAGLGAFPKSYADAAATSAVFVGTWNTAFAVHSGELLSTASPGAADRVKSAPLPLAPVIELPPVSEFPRSGIVPLGWKEIGDAGDSRIAVLVELDASRWTPTSDELKALEFPQVDGKIPLENVERYDIGSFQILVGREIQEAAGAVWQWRNARTRDEGVIATGQVTKMESDGQALLVAEESVFAVAGTSPSDRSGRDLIMVWSNFSAGEGPRPAHFKAGDGEWQRVPDRLVIPPDSPVPENSD